MSRVSLLTAGCLALVVSSSALADEPAKKSPVTAAKPWVVTGRVVNEAGEPMAGATATAVHLKGDPEATTGDDGRFEIPIPETYHSFMLTHDGMRLFLEIEKGESRAYKTIHQKIGNPEPVVITLWPPHEIRVEVTDAAGAPLEGVDVAIPGWDHGTTDNTGRWTGTIPSNIKSWSVYAIKPGVGFDYATSKIGRPLHHQHKPLPDKLSFTLSGAYPLRIKTVDESGKPLAGVSVSPQSIWIKDRQQDVIIWQGRRQEKTNRKGTAAFNWLPADFSRILLSVHLPGYDTRRNMIAVRARDHIKERTIILVPDEPDKASEKETADPWGVRGWVTDQSGKSIEGALVTAIVPDDIPATKSDSQGTFKITIPPQYRDEKGFRAIRFRAEKGELLGRSWTDDIGDIEKPMGVTLGPAHRIQVDVSDASGGPVANANVVVLLPHYPFASGRTDEEGRWSCRVPGDAGRWAIYAKKPGAGFNYETAMSGRRPHGGLQFKSLPEKVSLTLHGARTLRVKTVDTEGAPLEGIQLVPRQIRTTGHEHYIFLGRESGPVETTNAEGVAVFNWLPRDFVRLIAIDALTEDYNAFDEATFLRERDPVEEMTITLYPTGTISGRVIHADGSPAAGIHIIADGAGINNGHGGAVTDAKGRYHMRLNSEQAYLVRIEDETWGTRYKAPVVVRAGEPATGVNFTLAPPTRLHGRVTVGPDNEPLAHTNISLEISAGHVPQEIQELDPDDHSPDRLRDAVGTRTDGNGVFEFLLGPGSYELRNPAGSIRGEPIPIPIPEKNPPREIEQNIHLDRALKGPLTIEVVNQQGELQAYTPLLFRYLVFVAPRWERPAKTDEHGRLQTTRKLEELVIEAIRPDDALKGIARVDAKAEHAKVVVGPTTSVTGILRDDDGKFIANGELRYQVRLHRRSPSLSVFVRRFGGHATTDVHGHFAIAGLIPGENYRLTLITNFGSHRGVTEFMVPDAKPLDLGDIEVYTEPYNQTPAQRATEDFEAPAGKSAVDQVEELIGTARGMYTTPLVLVGRPENPACIELFRRFYETPSDEKETAMDLLAEVELLALDINRRSVQQWAKQQGVSMRENNLPVLLAFSTNGEIIDRLELLFLTEPVVAPIPGVKNAQDKGQGQQTLLSFLRENKRPTRNAEAMLAEAFATAVAEDKNVFLICSASWCGPCRHLAEFLEPYHEELEEHYVFVHLDVSRDTHAREINQKYKCDRSGGVPWFVILDPEGNELISSNLPSQDDEKQENEPEYETSGQNMGFPGGREKTINHFLHMLKSTSEEIDSAVLKKMRTELESY